MPDKIEIEEVPAQANALGKFMAALTKPFQKRKVAKALTEADKQVILAAASALAETGDMSEPVALMLSSVKAALGGGGAGPGPMMEEEEPEEEVMEMATETALPGAALQKSVEAQLAAIQKATNARIEAVEKQWQTRLDTVEKQYQSRLEILKKEADQAVESREQREWLEKAAEFTFAIPATPAELAGKLQRLNKADPEMAKYFVELPMASDHALMEAGFFSELGSSRTPEEKSLVEKTEAAAKTGDREAIEKAILEMPEEEQWAYLEARRQGGKR